METKKTLLIQSLIALLPMGYLLILWKNLPIKIPMHFDVNAVADRYGEKSELLIMTLFLILVTIGVSALLLNINKIDPKQAENTDLTLMRKISWALVIFMTLLQFFIVYQTTHYQSHKDNSNSTKIIFLLVIALFTTLGNLMQNVKPNYFVGIRTAWTLSSEEIWRKTHRLAGKMMFYGGLLLFILIIFSPSSFSFGLFITGILLMTLIPILYSFLLYQKEKKIRVN